MKTNKIYFNPETDGYQTTPAKPSVLSHLNYLANQTNNLVDAEKAFDNHPLDWADFATEDALKRVRDGYIPERYFPYLVDFWRTNSVPSAIRALKDQKVLK